MKNNKPTLKKYPVGGNIPSGFNPITGHHYLAPGEKPLNIYSLGYSRGDSKTDGEYISPNGAYSIYTPVAPNTPEWNNVDNPLYKASTTTNTTATPTKTKPDLRWPTRTDYSAGSVGPRYQQTPTFKNGGMLPKFFPGGVTSLADQEAIDQQAQHEALHSTPNNDSTSNSSNNTNYGKYAAAGTIAATGIAGSANTLNSNASIRQKSESMDGTVVGTASAINPIVGGIIGAGDAIGKPIRNNAERMDANGNLQNQNAAQAGAIVGGLFDPIKALTTRASYKGGFTDLTGKGYANALEKEAKDKMRVDTPYVQKEKDPQDQVWAKQNNYDTFAMGGVNPNQATAEVEKEEVLQMPNGHTDQVDGPTHAQGGVPVNIPGGTHIFSDRLKLPGEKKTFAKLAEKFKTGKEDKVLSNPDSDLTAKTTAKLIAQVKQAKLDQLFQAQESLKQSKVQAYAKKLGIELPQAQPQQEAPQMRNGGNIPKYWNGGLAKMTQADIDYAKSQEDKRLQDQKQSQDYTVNTLLQNSGNIADLAMTKFGTKYDKENYGQIDPRFVKPQYVSARESLRDADVNANTTRGAIKDATGGNGAAFLSNQIMNSTNNTMNKAKIREQYENQNTGIYNQADQMNTGIKNDNLWRNKELSMRERSDTQQNKARSEDIARQAARGIGTNTSAAHKDFKSEQQDQELGKMMTEAFKDPEFKKFYADFLAKRKGQ